MALEVDAADPAAFLLQTLTRWPPMNPPAPQTSTSLHSLTPSEFLQSFCDVSRVRPRERWTQLLSRRHEGLRPIVARRATSCWAALASLRRDEVAFAVRPGFAPAGSSPRRRSRGSCCLLSTTPANFCPIELSRPTARSTRSVPVRVESTTSHDRVYERGHPANLGVDRTGGASRTM